MRTKSLIVLSTIGVVAASVCFLRAQAVHTITDLGPFSPGFVTERADAFYGGYFTNDAGAHIDASGSAWFANVIASSTMSAGEAFTTPLSTITGIETYKTNAIANWPAAPASRGACTLVNSNGTLYALVSGPNGNAWTATNKIAGP